MRSARTLAVAMAFAFGLACSQASQGASAGGPRIEAIQKRGTLRVAVLAEYPWLTAPADGGQNFGGPAWQLVQAIAARLGVRIEPVPVRFEDKVAVLSRDAADLTAAPMLVTPARTAQADLVAYSVSAQCFFGRADDARFSQARTIDDLDRPDVTVAVITGTPAEGWLAKRIPSAKQRVIPGSGADIPVDEVTSGRADAATIDKFFVAALLKQSPGLATLPRGAECLASHEMEIPVGIAIAKGQPAFLELLQATAREAMPDIKAEEAKVLSGGP